MLLSKMSPYLISALVLLGVVWYIDGKLGKIEFDYAGQSKELERLHKKELDAVNSLRNLEKSQLQANIIKLQQDLLKNQQDYEKKLLEINVKKDKEARQLSMKAPKELSDEVSRITGFKVYMQ
jgi:hypothetical protein